MSREAIETLVEKWMNEAPFRAEMRKNPETAVKHTGAQLSADEWAAIKAINWGLPDADLKSRISNMA